MEFWGVEVKAGETVKCEPGEEKYLHLSQAALGESKDKGSENVRIFVKFNDQKLVLGTLSAEKCAQMSYDLVFEKEFELSHNSKHASVHFIGYKTITQDPYSSGEDDFPGSESESEEDLPIAQNANGKPKAKDEQDKPGTGKAKVIKEDNSAAKAKAKTVEPVKAVKPKADEEDDEDADEDDSEDDDGSEDGSDDEDMNDAISDDSEDEDDESSEEEDEATPQKVASGKKRSAESASKTPVPEKKAKVVTPAGGQKTGGEKKAHTATPHPAKQAGKTPANNDKAKQQTPKSAGSAVSCKSCTKTFNSDNALQAHSKAKHGAAK